MSLGEIFRLILIFILVIVVFALIGGLFVDSDFGVFTVPIALLIIVLIFSAVFMSVESLNDKKNEVLKKSKEKKDLQKAFQASYREQIQMKKNIEVLSNLELKKNFDEHMQGKTKNEMLKMIIEEEMVRRGSLEKSPTKEKIDLLRKKFFEE